VLFFTAFFGALAFGFGFVAFGFGAAALGFTDFFVTRFAEAAGFATFFELTVRLVAMAADPSDLATRREAPTSPPPHYPSHRQRFLHKLLAATTRMDEPHIEQATLEDLPQLTDLLGELFTLESDFTPDRAKQMRGLRLILEQPSRGRIFVIRQNGMILGMINLLFTISTAEGGFVILLEDVIIHRDFRHQGLGAKLLAHCIDYAKKKDFLRITLLTDRVNEEGKRFFKAHGFFESHMIPLRLILNQRS
jgi:GNAT superfamily N-acetyltransferase